MKFTRLILLIALLSPIAAWTRAADTSLIVLGRRHADLSESMSDRPYGDGDVSYGVFADLFDGAGAWRLGASFSDDVSGVEGVDQVITPELGLLVVDRIWETGIAVLVDYVETESDSDWGDVYFQAHLGLNFQVTSSLSAGIQASYPFDSIDGLSDVDFDALDFAGVVRFSF